MSVSDRFTTFLSNISLTVDQKTRGAERKDAVVKALNAHYWGSTSNTANSTYVGSWGKFTRMRPPRDVDVLFTLPASVYNRFQLRSGNKQSQLLQEVKNVLSNTFDRTAIRGDGPVVIVPFTAYSVEVIPAFSATAGGHLVCFTDGGGHYERADYAAEAASIKNSNDTTKNTRDLVRMMKRWQGYCSVPIKSFYLELLAVEFLGSWAHRGKSATWYDYMVRDFLEFMIGKADGYLFAPGTYALLALGSGWKSKAESALARAKKACDYEPSYAGLAGDEWQKIFGTDIPRNP